ncbi:putative short-chain dehydrogenase/reductase [Actinoplanes missouriensis 431]|uniref:Putative short-chain dehydrogenase/reductase n=1 Tax=Actinoplanes missouriensis (strain ATCC 14538 / DSM 43046 / CBS 188.64 / JCM 3121 / NBRC 102363 / NCIMB 12654 / NRRL B-3342 / UNCC 431) TaxID=512565 RepID=I0H463_ACTM4|nr:SDR family oxidoreductase [Actinoplanes missouriensis]BAL87800.1 putative short-chain dehydrogenase/reductase [Actinoplanes missouriensis 431]
MDEPKIWLVTGSSRGLGRAITEAAASSGAKVMATARQPDQLNDLITAYPGRVETVALDVTNPAAARRAVRSTVEAFGRLDVVVNNAGYADSAPIEEMSDEGFRAQIDANLFGVVNVTRAALPVLRAQRSGVFVHVTSIGGRVGGAPGMSACQTAKFAVEGFSEVLAAETGPFGVKVIIVEPGAFRTESQDSSLVRHPAGPDYEATVGRSHRFGDESQGAEPGDPARAAEVIVRVVTLDDPPRRLPLGSDALTAALAAGAARTAEAARWADLSRSTDYRAA